MTISGGEPTAQLSFCRALLAAARAAGIHTCLETSACAAPAALRDLVPLTDLFLIDCKESDPERHLRFTGVTLERVRAGTRAAAEAGAAIRLRCPIVPGLNDRPDHFDGIAAFAASLPGIQGIEVMPYHPLGASKARSIGRDYPLPDLPFAKPDQAEGWRQAIAGRVNIPII
jgi:pyruvate formate lyase activating enzyme